jgi:putative ABC transport system ATP-binding protein
MEKIMENIEQNKNKATVIRVKNLCKDFQLGENIVNVLKDVSLTVDEGEFVILAGPSGCGKSTLLHTIYGLEEPTKGSVLINEFDIWSKKKNWRADFRNKFIGFIPQQAFWIKSLSVIENIAIPAAIGGGSFAQGLERAAKLLEMVGMENWAHHRSFDLSGGQQQRIALARALLLNPRFLIADEPTGNLDQKAGQELIDLLVELNNKFNITILMVTHNPLQYKYASRIVSMLDGKIISEDAKFVEGELTSQI